MNPDSIAHLRADSLAATLSAARGRRVRRHAGRLALAAIACAAITLSLLPRRTPAPLLVAATQPLSTPVVSRDTHIIHTAPGAVARITTSETSLVRFSTDSSSRVERIDTAGLARCFPDQGIAVIHPAGELAKIVLF